MVVEAGKGIVAVVVYGILLAIGFKIGAKIYETAEKKIPEVYPELNNKANEAGKKLVSAVGSVFKGW